MNDSSEDSLVCRCYRVPDGKIRQAIGDHHLHQVEEITAVTHAGGGCGSCYDDIQQLLCGIWGKPLPRNVPDASGLSSAQKRARIVKMLEGEVQAMLDLNGLVMQLVDVSGDRVLVGSWLDDDDGSLSGSAYVFRREDNGTSMDPTDDFWVEEAKLTAPDAAAGDEFGKSVSLDGGRAAIGAFEDDDACADDPDPDPNCDSGSGYLFQLDDNDTPLDPSDDFWMEQSKLTASDTAFGTFFGRVAVSGDWVIAASLDAAAGDRAGAAYMFSFTQVCSDLADFADFQTCASGEGGGVFSECEVFNVDSDEDVDLVDYAQLLRTFTGP